MRKTVGGLFFLIALFTLLKSNAKDIPLPEVNVEDLVSVLIEQEGIKSNSVALDKFNSVLTTLVKKQKQYKEDDDFIEYLYYYTHRKLLKRYVQYPSLAETLEVGDYDCLTATATYSFLLSELAIPHAVVETNYHIYILVYPDSENEILLEATDPQNGFITRQESISQQKELYRQANKEVKENQIDFNFNIERRLEGKELIGLLYYNLSIKQLNLRNWQKADELATEANKYYPNIRVRHLRNFIDTSRRSASL